MIMGRYIFDGKIPLMEVEKPKLHNLYHVSWAYSKGVVGRCVSIDEINKTVVLRKPKTGKDFKNPVKWSDLRHTRTNQARLSKTK